MAGDGAGRDATQIRVFAAGLRACSAAGGDVFVTTVAALLTGLGVLCMAAGRDDGVIGGGILSLLIGAALLTWQIWPEPAVVRAETHDRGAPAPLRRSP